MASDHDSSTLTIVTLPISDSSIKQNRLSSCAYAYADDSDKTLTEEELEQLYKDLI